MADFDRRSFIKIGSIAAFSYIKWGDVLQRKAEAASRRGDEVSVIHLFLTGGMSQIDTFDPKPDCKPEFRSQFKSIPTSIPVFIYANTFRAWRSLPTSTLSFAR